jgi:RimJ/RimL family protein N-acetyltransferase
MSTVAHTTHTDSGSETLRSAVAALEPGEWPKHQRTHDGVEYRIRPLRVDDFDRDRRFLLELSPASRYNRMLGYMGDPSAKLVEHLVSVDYRHSMALAAVIGAGVDESIIAVARYEGDPDRSEFAVAVADDWQSRGIGTTLSNLLFDYAKAHGVRRMYAVTFACNHRMLKLAGDLDMNTHPASYDTTVVEAWRTL